MVNDKLIKEQLRQTQIMTILSEKRTVLSELRTWITMILLPLSIMTASLAILKYNENVKPKLFTSMLVFSGLFVFIVFYFIIKNLKELFKLNKRVHKIDLP
ncbi:hypothetical protein HYX18_03245 [Candidatus Woesearchaeota archaeon]|nr:hypothetical protein [Candidatus Woesearchaeota archaeon]